MVRPAYAMLATGLLLALGAASALPAPAPAVRAPAPKTDASNCTEWPDYAAVDGIYIATTGNLEWVEIWTEKNGVAGFQRDINQFGDFCDNPDQFILRPVG